MNESFSKSLESFRENIGLKFNSLKDSQQNSVILHPQASASTSKVESLWNVVSCSSKQNASETLSFIMNFGHESGGHKVKGTAYSDDETAHDNETFMRNSFTCNDYMYDSDDDGQETIETFYESDDDGRVTVETFDGNDERSSSESNFDSDDQSYDYSVDSDTTLQTGVGSRFMYPHNRDNSIDSSVTMLQSMALNSQQSSCSEATDFEHPYNQKKSYSSVPKSSRHYSNQSHTQRDSLPRRYTRYDSFSGGNHSSEVVRKRNPDSVIAEPLNLNRSITKIPTFNGDLGVETFIDEQDVVLTSKASYASFGSTSTMPYGTTQQNVHSARQSYSTPPTFDANKENECVNRNYRKINATSQPNININSSFEPFPKPHGSNPPPLSYRNGDVLNKPGNLSNSYSSLSLSSGSFDSCLSDILNDRSHGISARKGSTLLDRNENCKTLYVPPGKMGLTLKTVKRGVLILSVSSKSVCPSLQEGEIILSVDGTDVSYISRNLLSGFGIISTFSTTDFFLLSFTAHSISTIKRSLACLEKL